MSRGEGLKRPRAKLGWSATEEVEEIEDDDDDDDDEDTEQRSSSRFELNFQLHTLYPNHRALPRHKQR